MNPKKSPNGLKIKLNAKFITSNIFCNIGDTLNSFLNAPINKPILMALIIIPALCLPTNSDIFENNGAIFFIVLPISSFPSGVSSISFCSPFKPLTFDRIVLSSSFTSSNSCESAPKNALMDCDAFSVSVSFFCAFAISFAILSKSPCLDITPVAAPNPIPPSCLNPIPCKNDVTLFKPILN